MTEQLKNKKVLVVGLAKSGAAAARLLSRLGARVCVTERDDSEAVLKTAEELKRDLAVQVECGRHTETFFAGAETVVVSPGVPSESVPLRWAKQNKIPVLSEIELAFRAAGVPVIAVTGSNGKTTTTTLIHELLSRAGFDAPAGGNLGTPFSELVFKKPSADIYVVEVSSFQLEHVRSFAPVVAVLTNVSPNHLDRHPALEHYRQTKARIFENQQAGHWAVVHEKDLEWLPVSSSQTLAVRTPGSKVLRGCYVEDGALRIMWQGEDLSLLPLEQLQIKGEHNLENICFAVNAVLPLGVKAESIRQTLKNFKGLEHRQEKILEKDGILFVNDSKATSIDAVRSALKNYSSIRWIAGGRNKGCDFGELAGEAGQSVIEATFFGECRQELFNTFRNVISCNVAENLEEAVTNAVQKVLPGEVILFSPGCASFDMFTNYEHRGKQFKEIVFRLEAVSEQNLTSA